MILYDSDDRQMFSEELKEIQRTMDAFVDCPTEERLSNVVESMSEYQDEVIRFFMLVAPQDTSDEEEEFDV